jgi:predicted unusual protein kinase regulating ubiquinone biosynthesis (AarF/ABC1/UbiB family)
MADIEQGRLGRALRLSRMGARVALQQGRALISGDPSAAHRDLARTLAEELGKLKGLPMKIGQILSYMEGVVPDEHRDTYREALASLRTRASPLGMVVCREVIEQELGTPLAELFDRFDPDPIAAASLGQVYRGSWQGREVAIKVQYPGIAEASTSDLANLDQIARLMRTLMPGIDTQELINDFRARLVEECDYHQEANHQARFAELLGDDPDLCVPEVIAERSTGKVLTTTFLHGITLDAFVADASQAERDRAGKALFRLAFGTLLQHGLFHADPHPGNLLFRVGPEQRLAVLDFGCVQPVDDHARRELVALIRAALDGQPLQGRVQAGLGLGALDPETEAMLVEITRHILQPVLAPQPFRFDRTFAQDIARRVIDAKTRLAPRMLTRRAWFEVERPGVMFVVRNLFGLASLWGELGSEGDFRALIEQILASSPS